MLTAAPERIHARADSRRAALRIRCRRGPTDRAAIGYLPDRALAVSRLPRRWRGPGAYVEAMTGVSGALLAGLPDELQRLLVAPPITEKKLLELSVSWTGLTAGQARMARALRLFVITWDPLERLAPRPNGFATVNGGPPDLELVVYTPVWSVVELATTRQSTRPARPRSCS